MAMRTKSDIHSHVNAAVNAFYKLAGGNMKLTYTRIDGEEREKVTTFDISAGYIGSDNESHYGYGVLVRTVFNTTLPDMYPVETYWECPTMDALVTAITDTLYAGRKRNAYVVFDTLTLS